MGLFKKLHRSLSLFFTKLVLSERIRKRADRYFKRTLREYKKKHHKKPDRNKKFLLVVKASHRTIGIRKARGISGHIKRQWIRKYLLLKYRIRDNYKIQEGKRNI